MDKRNFAFDKVNFILLAVGMAIVIIGFIRFREFGNGIQSGRIQRTSH